MQRIFIKKCFLFTVGSVCHVKRFTTGGEKLADGRSNVAAETSQKTSIMLVTTHW
jgi:hypothetical protein